MEQREAIKMKFGMRTPSIKKAAYNKVYKKTSFGIMDLFK